MTLLPRPNPASELRWEVRGGVVDLSAPVIMGVVNATPDSFSDGGKYLSVETAVEAGISMVADGAAIIDVGGESTRPGSDPVPTDVELARTIPVVARLAARGLTVSIDTSKTEVARAAIEAGAAIVNDVTGLADPEMVDLCASTGAGAVVMHMLGDPRTMQDRPHYDDVVGDVLEFLTRRAAGAQRRGVVPGQIVIDPGIGFGKTLDHNLILMRSIDRFAATGYPVLVGASRKRFLGAILEPLRGATTPQQRDRASAAAVAVAVAGGARVLRVHSVPSAVEVAHVVHTIVNAGGS
ncbi:MAG: dihydropteroate synthase [Acidimicrobiia bacterium]